jgi:DNA-binding beta-propeller fold protein YncE
VTDVCSTGGRKGWIGRHLSQSSGTDEIPVWATISIFNTNTWARAGTIRPSTPFVTAVANKDGSMIYVMTGERSRVLAIDAVVGRELRAMPLDRAPSLALVAP